MNDTWLIDRIRDWRAASADVENATGEDAHHLKKQLDDLRREIEQDVAGSRSRRDSFAEALATVALERLSPEQVRADLAAVVLGGPVAAPMPLIGKAEDRKRPEPILTTPKGGVVLAAGEAAVLAGAGGGGKSRLALQLAMAAAGAPDNARVEPFRCEDVKIAAGPAVYVAYEDSAAWMHWRAERMANWFDKKEPSSSPHLRAARDANRLRLYCPDYAGALFQVAPGARPGTPEALPRPTAWWHLLWEELRAMQPRLIVVDPVALAYAVDGHGAVGVGRFIGAIRRELTELEKPCAALLIAHTSRAGRRKQRDEADAAPMGSVAWIDRPRAVLLLERERDEDEEGQDSDVFALKLVKANYARTGPLARLRVDGSPPTVFTSVTGPGITERLDGEKAP